MNSFYLQLGNLYLSAAIILSAVISVYAWRHMRTRGNRWFSASCFLSVFWMVGELFVRNTNLFSIQWFGECLKYLGAAFLPVSLLMFTLQYCGRWPRPRSIMLLCLVPVISFTMLLTNSWHHLFFSAVVPGDGSVRTDYGIYFWSIHTPYSYGLMAACFFTLLVGLSGSSRRFRRQMILLVASYSIPLLVNVLSIFGIVGKLTPYSFPVFFSIVSYAIFRLQFLDGNPIAFETVFKTIRDGVLILDRNDMIHDINPAAARETGRSSSQIVGRHVRTVFAAWPEAIELYDRNPEDLGTIEVDLSGVRQILQIDSTPIAGIAINESGGRIITIRNITDRYQHQMTLEAMAFHDSLTRVANRRKFQEEVERAVESSKEKGEGFGILYFDLNKFKSVNDSFGHDVGDELLKYVAARVASTLRKPDILARLGGDEFVILLHGCTEDGIGLVISRVLENVSRPFKVGETELIAELSIGTAFYPQNGTGLTELLRHADTEMYRAKRRAPDYTYQLSPTQPESILEM
ncbi:MAG: diguanylate cyclase [Acidobacteria bacterium]|nr:diguanylate cyclase [Acidobacteriota bacterium]